MTDEIRRVLSAWFASPDGSKARQERIRARIAELETKEEPVRKPKWPRVLALALVSMLLVGTGMAAGLSLNLFNFLANRSEAIGYFDWEQQKLDNLRDKNTLVSTSASDVPQGIDMGDTMQIHDAYYDGDVLFVGCVMSRAMSTVEWTPTAEDLAQFALPSAIRTEDYEPVDQTAETLIEQAFEAGQPLGFKQYYHGYDFTNLETIGGERLWYTFGTGSDYMVFGDEEHMYGVVQFMSPLPEDIRGKDRIEVQLPIRFRTTCYWYDGEELYIWKGEDERAMLTAVIDREQDVPQGRYESAKIILEGTEVTVEAEASPYLLHVRLSADEPIFVLSPDVIPWLWSVCDDAEHELSKSFGRGYGPTPMRTDVREYSTDGLYTETWMWLYGEIPETLTLEIGKNDRKDEAAVTLRLAE